MNETEFIHNMAELLNVSFKEAKNSYDTIIGCITEQIEKKEQVKLVNFGSFEVVRRAPKKGFNPYYRKSVDVPACNEPVFKPGKELKELIKSLPD